MLHRSRSMNRTVFCARGINISVLKIAHENEVKSAPSERKDEKKNTQMQNKQEKNYRVFFCCYFMTLACQGRVSESEREKAKENSC